MGKIMGVVDDKTCEHCKRMHGKSSASIPGNPPMLGCENLPTEENPDGIGCRCYIEGTPRRIQRKRTKGYKLPKDAIYVGRPTKWGNPYHLPGALTDNEARVIKGLFAVYVEQHPEFRALIRAELRGKDLACFCPLTSPCHADVLLEVANGNS